MKSEPMRSKHSSSILLPVWIAIVGMACPPVSGQVSPAPKSPPEIPHLLQPSKVVRRTRRVINSEVTQRRAVDIDIELVSALAPGGANQLVFNLFDDASFTGRVKHREFPATRIGYRETIALRGIFPDYAGSSFQLVWHRGVLAADIRIPGLGEYQIRATAPGVHEAWKIDPGQYPDCLTDETMQLAPSPDQLKSNPAESSFVEDGSRIDVIILYTTNARILMGGVVNAEAEALLALLDANAAFANSLVTTRLNLVHLDEIAYSESGNAATDLIRLTNPGDGFIDGIHAFRDSLGADNVSLFVSAIGGCGIAWLMNNVTPAFQGHSFNVVEIGCAAGNLTYAHEVGHNLGCQHNRESAGGVTGAFPYSFGYWAPDESFRTVLALSNGSPRVMQFSNPEVTFAGQPTGIAAGLPDAADNAKTINNTAFTMANFRQAVCPDILPASDCNLNCIEDAIDIADTTSFDCNTNGIPDECDISSESSSDCNANGIPDECEDCNNNGIADSCDIADGIRMDCNANGIPDDCEDCNNNGIADSCEFIAPFFDSSPVFSPFGSGASAIHTLVSPPTALSDVTMSFEAVGMLTFTFHNVDVLLNGTFIDTVFKFGASNCPLIPDMDLFVVDMDTFNTLVAGGDAVLVMQSSNFLPEDCDGATSIAVTIDYIAPTATADVNANGLPDECDLARGDVNLDGVINVSDLIMVLAAWGTCDWCPEDGNVDGFVNVTDLLNLLAGWG